MLRDCRDSDVAQYQVVDAETGDPITDVIAACEEEGWLLCGTHQIGSSWVYPGEGDRCVELLFRRVRIVPATSISRVSTSTQTVARYQIGGNVFIRSDAAALSKYDGRMGTVEKVWEASEGFMIEVRVPSAGTDVKVQCRPGDLLLMLPGLRGGVA